MLLQRRILVTIYASCCSDSLTNVSSYVCGLKWKTCKCEEAHEHRLLDRAEEIVDRDEPHVRPFLQPRAQGVDQTFSLVLIFLVGVSFLFALLFI